jgi:LmbE family N-acetylglucosaminyl deacetylase
MMAADELASLRKAEGYAAARVLGVDAHDVHAFGFTDSKLSAHAGEAIQRVGELLRSMKPLDVFVPYCRDRLADHVATHRIVTSALEASGMALTVYEYPIWFWQHWPWAKLEHLPRRSIWTAMRESTRSTVGLLRECRCCARLSDAEQRKKHAALAEHRSQTTRLLPDRQWPILSDVWDGDFLACCFQEQEIFVRREVRPRR